MLQLTFLYTAAFIVICYILKVGFLHKWPWLQIYVYVYSFYNLLKIARFFFQKEYDNSHSIFDCAHFPTYARGLDISVLLIFLGLFLLRERKSVDTCVNARGGEAESKGERIPSRFRTVTVEPNEGLSLTNCEIRT